MDQKSQKFWANADQLMVMISGGVALGTAMARLPGTILGGLVAIGCWYYISIRKSNR